MNDRTGIDIPESDELPPGGHLHSPGFPPHVHDEATGAASYDVFDPAFGLASPFAPPQAWPPERHDSDVSMAASLERERIELGVSR